jgi:hypothetical protein
MLQVAGAFRQRRTTAHEHAYRHVHARADLDVDARTDALTDSGAMQLAPMPAAISAAMRKAAAMSSLAGVMYKAAKHHCESMRWQMSPSATLPTVARKGVPAASPTLALTAVARADVPTVVPTHRPTDGPSHAPLQVCVVRRMLQDACQSVRRAEPPAEQRIATRA